MAPGWSERVASLGSSPFGSEKLRKRETAESGRGLGGDAAIQHHMSIITWVTEMGERNKK